MDLGVDPQTKTSQLDTLVALLALDRLPRTGWILRGVADPESVAAHSFGTALVALALGPAIEPPLNVDRAVSLALIHDTPEVCMGDIPRTGAELLPAGAKSSAEKRAFAQVLAPLSDYAEERGWEFQVQETRESRFARLCDKLQLGVRLLGYVQAGARGLGEFREGLEGLDCAEFGPCGALRDEILAALGELP
jgi:putative hydrolase of HD superfamily